MNSKPDWEVVEQFATVHRSLNRHAVLEETSRDNLSTPVSSRESWACSRGLMPRGKSQVPSALDGQISKDTIKVMAESPPKPWWPRPKPPAGKFFGEHFSPDEEAPAVESISRAPSIEISRKKSVAVAQGGSRCLYFTLDIRGLTSKAMDNTMKTLIIAQICDMKGVWSEIGHTEVVDNLNPVYKHAFRVPLRNDKVDLSAARFTCYRWIGPHAQVADIAHDSSVALSPTCAICASRTDDRDELEAARAPLLYKVGTVDVAGRDVIPDDKRGGKLIRYLRRLKAPNEVEMSAADQEKWTRRAWERVRNRILGLGDLGHQQGDNLHVQFKRFDTGGAGTIDTKEFLHGLVLFNVKPATQKQASDLFSLCDVDGDGEITYAEFQAWVRGPQGVMSVQSEVAWETEREFASLLDSYHAELASRISAKSAMEKQARPRRLRKTISTENALQIHVDVASGTPQDARAKAKARAKKRVPELRLHSMAHASTLNGLPYFWHSDRPGNARLLFHARPRPHKPKSLEEEDEEEDDDEETPGSARAGRDRSVAGEEVSREELGSSGEEASRTANTKPSARWRKARIIGNLGLLMRRMAFKKPVIETEDPFYGYRPPSTEDSHGPEHGQGRPLSSAHGPRLSTTEAFLQRSKALRAKGLPQLYHPPMEARSMDDDIWMGPVGRRRGSTDMISGPLGPTPYSGPAGRPYTRDRLPGRGSLTAR